MAKCTPSFQLFCFFKVDNKKRFSTIQYVVIMFLKLNQHLETGGLSVAYTATFSINNLK